MHPPVPQTTGVFCTDPVLVVAASDVAAAVSAAACLDIAAIERTSAAARARMSLCIRFSVPVAVGFNEDDVCANSESTADAIGAPSDRRA